MNPNQLKKRQEELRKKSKSHCWKDKLEYVEEKFGWGSEKWCEVYRDRDNGSCML